MCELAEINSVCLKSPEGNFSAYMYISVYEMDNLRVLVDFSRIVFHLIMHFHTQMHYPCEHHYQLVNHILGTK